MTIKRIAIDMVMVTASTWIFMLYLEEVLNARMIGLTSLENIGLIFSFWPICHVYHTIINRK